VVALLTLNQQVQVRLLVGEQKNKSMGYSEQYLGVMIEELPNGKFGIFIPGDKGIPPAYNNPEDAKKALDILYNIIVKKLASFA
jgi:hypothetical protein